MVVAKPAGTMRALPCAGCGRHRRLRRIGLLLVVVGMTAGCSPKRGTIGARLGRDADGRLVVREAPTGLGAANAGVRAGDEVLLIDGEDVRALSEKRVHSALSGAQGSRVKLTLERGSEVLRVTVARTAIPEKRRER